MSKFFKYAVITVFLINFSSVAMKSYQEEDLVKVYACWSGQEERLDQLKMEAKKNLKGERYEYFNGHGYDPIISEYFPKTATDWIYHSEKIWVVEIDASLKTSKKITITTHIDDGKSVKLTIQDLKKLLKKYKKLVK